jgi:simple sugar transport system substrate-binding protein
MSGTISRRRVLAEAASAAAAGTLLAGTPWRALAQAPKPITVGFIYAATRNDYGWNQAHAVAAKRIAQLPGVKLVEQERVPETAQVERVMRA